MIASKMSGQGKFENQTYLMATYTAPLFIIAGVLMFFFAGYGSTDYTERNEFTDRFSVISGFQCFSASIPTIARP
jgi:hypothetical protein